MLKTGTSRTTSAHLALTITSGTQKITAAGDEKLVDGKLLAADLTENLGSMGTMGIRILGDTVYAKLPASMNPAGAGWVKADPTSSNPVIKALGGSIASVQNSSSPSSYDDFAAAASSVEAIGTETVGGAPATHYSLVVETAKLPVDNPSRQTLVDAGVNTIPVDLWVDRQGRLAKLTESVSVSGSTADTVITLSAFNARVSIEAPPADQIVS